MGLYQDEQKDLKQIIACIDRVMGCRTRYEIDDCVYNMIQVMFELCNDHDVDLGQYHDLIHVRNDVKKRIKKLKRRQ